MIMFVDDKIDNVWWLEFVDDNVDVFAFVLSIMDVCVFVLSIVTGMCGFCKVRMDAQKNTEFYFFGPK